MAMNDSTCGGCGRRIGWSGRYVDHPACGSCGWRPSLVACRKTQAEIDRALEDIEREDAEERVRLFAMMDADSDLSEYLEGRERFAWMKARHAAGEDDRDPEMLPMYRVCPHPMGDADGPVARRMAYWILGWEDQRRGLEPLV
jgi:hypothetical protein